MDMHRNVQIKAVFAQRSPSGGKYAVLERFAQLSVCQRIALFSLPVLPFQLCGKGSFALQNMLSRMPEKAVLYAERGFPAPEKPVSDSAGCEKPHCGRISGMP